MRPSPLIASILFAALAAPCASAQQSMKNAYPAKGQTPEQQQADLKECNRLAVSSSGYDPGKFQAAGQPQQAGFAAYQKVMRACMKGRGYTVQ